MSSIDIKFDEQDLERITSSVITAVYRKVLDKFIGDELDKTIYQQIKSSARDYVSSILTNEDENFSVNSKNFKEYVRNIMLSKRRSSTATIVEQSIEKVIERFVREQISELFAEHKDELMQVIKNSIADAAAKFTERKMIGY